MQDVLAALLDRGAAVFDFLVGADTSALPAAVRAHAHDHLRAP